MDINSIVPLDEDSGVIEHLRDPAGKLEYDADQQPLTMTIMGSWSDAFKKAAKDANKARQDAARKGETLTEAEDEALDYATEAACIKAWPFSANGKDLPITGENWKLLAAKRPNWRQQLLSAIGDHERFFAASSAP